jgi:hypothetical protein
MARAGWKSPRSRCRRQRKFVLRIGDRGNDCVLRPVTQLNLSGAAGNRTRCSTRRLAIRSGGTSVGDRSRGIRWSGPLARPGSSAHDAVVPKKPHWRPSARDSQSRSRSTGADLAAAFNARALANRVRSSPISASRRAPVRSPAPTNEVMILLPQSSASAMPVRPGPRCTSSVSIPVSRLTWRMLPPRSPT